MHIPIDWFIGVECPMIGVRTGLVSVMMAACGAASLGQSVYSWEEIPSIPGSSIRWPRSPHAINNSGHVAGFQTLFHGNDGNDFYFVTRGYIWRGGGSSTELPPDDAAWGSWAYSLNDDGVLVGFATFAPEVSGACFLNESGPIFFQSWSAGAIARDVNASAVSVGQMMVSGSGHAFFYDTSVHDLGTLGGSKSSARAINDAGVIVGDSEVSGGGTHAFVASTSSAMIDLNTLLSANSGWVLRTAADINPHGVVVGQGTLNGRPIAYKFDPSSGLPPEALPPLPGRDRSYAISLNAAGVVVGYSTAILGKLESTGLATAWAYGNAVNIPNATVNYGGTFWEALGINDWGQVIATWDQPNFDARLTPLCRADLNMDGLMNGDDFDLFSELFDGAKPGADFNVDGYVNGDDFDAYASAFDLGC